MAVRTDGARARASASRSAADPGAGRRGRVPVVLSVLAVVQAVATVVLAVVDGRGEEFLLEQTATVVVLSVSLAAVGALVAARHPRNPLGWLFLAAGLCQGLLAFSEEYAVRALLVRPGSLPLGAEASWVKEWIWVPGLAVILVFLPLLFPDGRPPSRRWWPVAWLGGVAVVLGCATAGASVWAARGPTLLADWGAAEYAVAPTAARLTDAVVFPLLVLAAVLAVASLTVRYRRASIDERRPLIWFLTAAGLTVVTVVLLELLPAEEGGAREIALAGVGLLVAPSMPVAVGAAILARRLYGIDIVVNRTLVYGALVLGVTAAYVAAVAGVGVLLPGDGELVASLVATGVVAAAFAPLRARLQRGVNRLMYGDRDDPYAALSRLARRTGAAAGPPEVVLAVAETVARAVRSPHVALTVATPGGRDTVVAEVGQPAGEPVILPLEHGGRRLGALLVSMRRTPFDAEERRLLDDLARHAAPVVASVQLTFDLQRSREQLVVAREEERRRLRRILHDGVGPALSSAVFKLAAVRRLLPAASPADDLLDELRADLRTTVGDVRALAYDLRPPSLDQLGLADALAEFVESRRDADEEGWSIAVTVEADAALRSLPAAVEVAAYWIAREALTNVVRHARATSCRVRLGECGPPGRRELALEVDDDGTGLGARPVAGVGTTAMRERAEELGGTVELTSTGAGTRVLARLPLGTGPT